MSGKFDLVFERTTSLTPEQIWKGWTDPETLMKWFCPRPWKVSECRLELKAGGEFYTLMQSPEGEGFPNHGIYLEIIPNQKLVWTNMMTAGFIPNPEAHLGFPFSVILNLSKTDKGTLYKAVCAHADEKGMKQHEAMGFQEGWGLAFVQLEELYK
jgi:uncharacterized protein YndB with AHSA1/START domain